MLRLPTKPKSTARKMPAMARVLGCLALVGMVISGLETTVEAAENDLADFGLANLAPLAAGEADEIQCQSLFTEHFGISFISGILYDPNTGSSIKAPKSPSSLDQHLKAQGRGNTLSGMAVL